MEGVNRRGFFKALGALVAAPVAWKLAPKEQAQGLHRRKGSWSRNASFGFNHTIPDTATLTGVSVTSSHPCLVTTIYYDEKECWIEPSALA